MGGQKRQLCCKMRPVAAIPNTLERKVRKCIPKTMGYSYKPLTKVWRVEQGAIRFPCVVGPVWQQLI